MNAEQVHNGTGRMLSSAQLRLWFAGKVESGSAEFTAPWVGRLSGRLDVDTLARAWRTVVARHAELRLRLYETGGEPRRSTWPVEDFPLTTRVVAPEELDDELAAAVTRVFDLVEGRLVAAELLTLGPSEHVLVLNAHHAVVDGRAMSVIVKDLCAAYAGRDLGAPSRPYLEYVEQEGAAGYASDRFHAWIEELRIPEIAEPLGLEARKRSADKQGALVRVPLPQATWEALRAFGREHRTTPQVLGLSALALTLGRYTDTDDLVIGGTMDTRSGEFADTVGMFVNPTPVRVRITQDQPVREFCQATQRSLLRSFSHRGVPFEEVVRRLQVTPDVTRTPVFQVLFNFEAAPPESEVPGLEIDSLDLPVRVSKYDLTLVLRDNGTTGELLATYRTARYDHAQIAQLTAHVAVMLERLLADGEAAVGSLELLSEEEKARQLATSRGPAVTEAFRPVHDVVAEIAATDPDRTAVVSGSTTLTYAELIAGADALAAELAGRGVTPGTPVAVLMEPSADTAVAVLGILRAGGYYVPLNPGHPVARLASVLADAGVEILVGDDGWQERLAVPVLSPCQAVGDGSVPFAPHAAAHGDAAYVIYTSGTAGEPKGVVVEHGSLAASTAARRMTYGGYDTFLLVSPLSFDSSVAGLWGTLTTGGRLVVAQTDDILDPERTVQLIEKHGVSALLCVPALYAGLLDLAMRTAPERLGTLEVVITAGEALPETLLTRHFDLLGPTRLVNEYGPTETTVWCTHRPFDRPEPVGIGGPVPGAALYVLDRQGRVMPHRTGGELYVGGAGVARGYLGRSDMTAQAFLPDPFSADEDARMYRTGDWVRWDDDGSLRFLGRRDQLVKVRGHRVELGAVEAALRSAEAVLDAAVLLTPGDASLTAFLVVGPGFDASTVRAQLTQMLPPPAVPGVLRVVPQLPRSAHGKVDKDALLALGPAADESTAEPGPAQAAAGPAGEPASVTALRAAVVAAWCDVLAVSSVPSDVNFFDAGGHSLLVPSLQAEIEDRAQAKVAIVDLFTATTVDAQVALLATDAAPAAPAVAAQPADARRARLAAGRSRRVTTAEDGS
ncbi:amino acid adenylation domain-containing protein [Streptomyces sp. NBC_01520]|uniref:non-ribosomal peptide synthetase n=2 Tax=unclassified Streptomyces TaxID=2593676 RepID=UPI0038686F95